MPGWVLATHSEELQGNYVLDRAAVAYTKPGQRINLEIRKMRDASYANSLMDEEIKRAKPIINTDKDSEGYGQVRRPALESFIVPSGVGFKESATEYRGYAAKGQYWIWVINWGSQPDANLISSLIQTVINKLP